MLASACQSKMSQPTYFRRGDCVSSLVFGQMRHDLRPLTHIKRQMCLRTVVLTPAPSIDEGVWDGRRKRGRKESTP